jgi:hypothetical protein
MVRSGWSRVAHRLVLEHVDSSHARMACSQRRDECPWFDQSGAAGVDEQGGRLHPSQVVAGDDGSGCGHKPHV